MVSLSSLSHFSPTHFLLSNPIVPSPVTHSFLKLTLSYSTASLLAGVWLCWRPPPALGMCRSVISLSLNWAPPSNIRSLKPQHTGKFYSNSASLNLTLMTADRCWQVFPPVKGLWFKYIMFIALGLGTVHTTSYNTILMCHLSYWPVRQSRRANRAVFGDDKVLSQSSQAVLVGE